MRLLNLGKRDPYEVASYHEMLLTARELDDIPDSLVIFQTRPIVFVGKQASMEKAVKKQFCDAEDILLIRVPSVAAHSLYYDERQLGAWLVYKTEVKTSRKDELNRLQRCISKAMEYLGLDTTLDKNSVLVGSKKVASLGTDNHGNVWVNALSILVDFDFNTAEKAIIPKHDMRETMTTINSETGRNVPLRAVTTALREGFESVLGIEFEVTDSFTEAEEQMLGDLSEKYRSEEWTMTGRWSPVKDYWRPS